jgi:hypothetical protein
MHRIGHVDILIDHGEIRLEDAKSRQSDARQGVMTPVSMQRVRCQILTPFGISSSLVLRVAYALDFRG